MHENSEISNGQRQSNPGHARQGQSRPASRAEHQSGPPDQTKITNGASFDDSQTFSGLRKLQDSSKFDKARFSFRLYKR